MQHDELRDHIVRIESETTTDMLLSVTELRIIKGYISIACGSAESIALMSRIEEAIENLSDLVRMKLDEL